MVKKSDSKMYWNGGLYSKVSDRQYAFNVDFLKSEAFPENADILDIGCGDARTTAYLAGRSPRGRTVGIDQSESMVAFARKRVESIDNIDILLKDAIDIDWKKTFNFVVSFFCMQWVKDKQAVFEKVHASLKEGGRFLMLVPLPHPFLPEIRNKLLISDRWSAAFSHYQDPLTHINDTHYERYALSAGFEKVDFVEKISPMYFQNYESFFDFMFQMTPHIHILKNESEKERFLEELLSEYAKLCPPDDQGRYRLDFNLLNFYSEKRA